MKLKRVNRADNKKTKFSFKMNDGPKDTKKITTSMTILSLTDEMFERKS